ncbi:2'-5' RNA ligase family protein [Pedobacter sp. MC2016-14]|uniref:2'-5' RNA ligase family protein n=1 Tax=Pedobacter sp. MC2016-14 TaxID=2897327 RepID=UPI001E2A4F94|nr:2'-5' RNA ligase family protein [Pedobacter sp. MC2016-14]MCD0486689.1 2'-5' RNA ligase family protein [Pedobacter sp. MC2016-14]
MDSNGLNQYLGIIEPDTQVASDVQDMKTRCKKEYRWLSAVYSKPHFTVFEIIQPASNEERLMKNFERNIGKISPFQIDLCGFDYFSIPAFALYVKLKNEKEFSGMAQYIRKFSNPILKSGKSCRSHYNIKDAHLTIAKGILEPDFIKVAESWKNLEYHSSTIADRIVLLRRPFTYVKLKYEKIGTYWFRGEGPLDTQISLF